MGASILEQALLHQSSASVMDIKFLRIARLLKMTKILRMIKVLQFVSSLRLVLACLMGCFPSLLRSVLMIILILNVFAMFIVQSVAIYVSEEGDDIDPELNSAIRMMFGSVLVAMMTLFQCCSGGENWVIPYRVLQATTRLNAAT